MANSIAGSAATRQRFPTSLRFKEALILSASGKPDHLEKQVRNAISEIDPNLSLIEFTDYEEMLHCSRSEERP